jgi:hypothetical protein
MLLSQQQMRRAWKLLYARAELAQAMRSSWR